MACCCLLPLHIVSLQAAWPEALKECRHVCCMPLLSSSRASYPSGGFKPSYDQTKATSYRGVEATQQRAWRLSSGARAAEGIHLPAYAESASGTCVVPSGRKQRAGGLVPESYGTHQRACGARSANGVLNPVPVDCCERQSVAGGEPGRQAAASS